jgi:hypothetical protein
MAQRQSMQGSVIGGAMGGRRIVMNSPPLTNHQTLVKKLAGA